jgi:hypothetical protein
MKVLNIHTRLINQPQGKIGEILQTLASKNDLMLATDKWPAMKLDNGLQIGSNGGHGPIGYLVETYVPGKSIQFRFTKPHGFDGIHKFEIQAVADDKTTIKHTIDMNTSFSGAIKWMFAIRWLHDAYIEDAFDKVENHFTGQKKVSDWNGWVKFLRSISTRKKKVL